MPRLHSGQRRVSDDADRFNVLRCGRRFGKTFHGQHEALDAFISGRLVGWFAPTYKILNDAWDQIVRRCNGAAKIIKSERQIRLGDGVIEFWSLDNNPDAGRSRRYHLAIVDEAGLVPGLLDFWRLSLRPTLVDFQGIAWFYGTPKPAFPDFNRLFDKGKVGEPGWRAWQCKTEDNPHIPKAEIEAARRDMPEWQFRQEFEGEPAPGMTGFFDEATIRNLIEQQRSQMPHVAIGDLKMPRGHHGEIEMWLAHKNPRGLVFEDSPHGELRLWCDLVGGDPSREFAYCIGVDLAAGVGASNTVFQVYNTDTRTKVAEFASPITPPDEAARKCAALGLWFRGRDTAARVYFEANGPGELFHRTIVKCGYPNLFKPASHEQAAMTGGAGWRSTPQSKETLLADYRSGLYSGRIINLSERALYETLTYHYDKSGRLVSTTTDADPTDDIARSPHGDRVIADALAFHMLMRAVTVAPVEVKPAAGTVAARVFEHREKERKSKRLRF